MLMRVPGEVQKGTLDEYEGAWRSTERDPGWILWPLDKQMGGASAWGSPWISRVFAAKTNHFPWLKSQTLCRKKVPDWMWRESPITSLWHYLQLLCQQCSIMYYNNSSESSRNFRNTMEIFGYISMAHFSGGSNFLHFHAVFRKNWSNGTLVPPYGVGASFGKSWIFHCIFKVVFCVFLCGMWENRSKSNWLVIIPNLLKKII